MNHRLSKLLVYFDRLCSIKPDKQLLNSYVTNNKWIARKSSTLTANNILYKYRYRSNSESLLYKTLAYSSAAAAIFFTQRIELKICEDKKKDAAKIIKSFKNDTSADNGTGNNKNTRNLPPSPCHSVTEAVCL